MVLVTESELGRQHRGDTRQWKQDRLSSIAGWAVPVSHELFSTLPFTVTDTALPLLLLETTAVSQAVIFKMKKCWQLCIILQQVKSSRKAWHLNDEREYIYPFLVPLKMNFFKWNCTELSFYDICTYHQEIHFQLWHNCYHLKNIAVILL